MIRYNSISLARNSIGNIRAGEHDKKEGMRDSRFRMRRQRYTGLFCHDRRTLDFSDQDMRLVLKKSPVRHQSLEKPFWIRREIHSLSVTAHPTVSMKTRAAWRSWLSKNHTIREEIWLVYAKKTSGIPSISYDDAVEEAICFGWIDGQVRTVDNDRYMQRFSPRTKKSRWSALNISRARKMIDAGLMTGAGLAIFDDAMQQDRTVPSRKSYSVPAELESALESNPVAAENFQNMAATHRLMYAAWVSSAKKQETRQNRVERTIAFLMENKRLIDVFGIKKKD